MYYTSRPAQPEATPAQLATQAATLTLVGLSVAIATASFWAKGWMIGAFLTPPLAAASWMLSQALPRFAEAVTKRHHLTACLTVMLGGVCLGIEANLVHAGAHHLNASAQVVPVWAESALAWGLGVFNIFASYTFGREIKKRSPWVRKARPAPAAIPAPPARLPAPAEISTPWIAETVTKIDEARAKRRRTKAA